jgi:ribosome-binding protein aMBF1 (putative translation factor)
VKKWSDVRSEIKSLTQAEKDHLRFVANVVGHIIERRNELGWSQQQLAEKVGVQQSAIARIENGGAIPRIDTLIKIANALGLKVQLVVDEEAASTVYV